MSSATVHTGRMVPEWPAQPLIDRLKTCRVMLYQHGMLSESERRKVDQRIDKREATLTDEQRGQS